MLPSPALPQWQANLPSFFLSALASRAPFCNRTVCGYGRVHQRMCAVAAGQGCSYHVSCHASRSRPVQVAPQQRSFRRSTQVYSFFHSGCCHATCFRDLYSVHEANKN